MIEVLKEDALDAGRPVGLDPLGDLVDRPDEPLRLGCEDLVNLSALAEDAEQGAEPTCELGPILADDTRRQQGER